MNFGKSDGLDILGHLIYYGSTGPFQASSVPGFKVNKKAH